MHRAPLKTSQVLEVGGASYTPWSDQRGLGTRSIMGFLAHPVKIVILGRLLDMFLCTLGVTPDNPPVIRWAVGRLLREGRGKPDRDIELSA